LRFKNFYVLAEFLFTVQKDNYFAEPQTNFFSRKFLTMKYLYHKLDLSVVYFFRIVIYFFEKRFSEVFFWSTHLLKSFFFFFYVTS